MGELDGKAVIITGAGRGIGAAYAATAAALGAAVLVNDIDADAAEASAATIAARGGRALAHAADISKWSDAGALVARCLSEFGKVDGLVNNAGLFDMARLDELREGQIERLLAVNVTGTVNCAAHAVRPMLERGRGSIVNVTSTAQMGHIAMSAYGATKGAVATMTYSWARELEGSGIRVNAVSPMGESRMVEVATRYYASHGTPSPGTPGVSAESNAPVVAYLLSDASEGVTGQVVRIEGEQLALLTHPAVMLPVRARAGGWTLEAVKQAFAQDLAARQAPLGVMGVKIAEYEMPAGLWRRAQKEAAAQETVQAAGQGAA